MSSIQNPFDNVGNSLPPQPFGSVVDQVKNNENVLIETAGLDPYTFVDVGQELSSQRTYIKPFYTTNEQYGTVLPIEVNNSMLPLGPVYVKKNSFTIK